MRHGYSINGSRQQHQHVTLCVSSQVGCAMKCVFCATGRMGIHGNLTSGEILEQLVHASSVLGGEKIRNVVFMGMGEPLNNYHNVVAACKAMVDRRTWSMQYHHVTVSTV
ncbi:radical SAM protein, partial [Patescibacteria group bacterium]|nr:radical SAM protein [Patescibacteria group bacterium]